MATPIPNYYQILGVPFAADFQAIKKAYRNLANTHHPDKNSGQDMDFALINEAYHVLKDPAKRQKYDVLYQQYYGIKNPYPFNTGSVLKNFGKQFGRFVKTAETIVSSGLDNLGKKPQLTIDFQTAMMGGDVVFEFLNKPVKVTLPKGLYTGAKIKLTIQHTPMWFVVDVITPSHITLDKKNVHLTCFLDVWQLALGETILVAYHTQSIQINLATVDVNQPITLAKQGIPALGNQTAGDLYIHLVVNKPDYHTLTDKQKQAFANLKQSFGL